MNSPEDGNRRSFRNVVFSTYLEFQTAEAQDHSDLVTSRDIYSLCLYVHCDSNFLLENDSIFFSLQGRARLLPRRVTDIWRATAALQANHYSNATRFDFNQTKLTYTTQ
jgi:hypothetical protein